MNIKRYLAAGFAVFITFQVLDYFIHSIILAPVYASLANVWRPDMMSLMWMMPLTSFLFSYLMAWIFVKGYEDRGIMEGVRFGILMCLFANGIGGLSQYSMYPLPFSLIVKWFLFGLPEFILAGIVLSLVYKNRGEVDVEE